jgi:hypothetical protein
MNGTSDYPAGTSGAGNTAVAAAFVDEAATSSSKDPTSPTVDSGDPLDAFSNEPAPNGSRINQGAFGNTRWAASRVAAGSGSTRPAGRRRHGGCGLLGLEVLLLLAFRLRKR